MTSRERVMCALNHQEPDRVPLDLGGSLVTGMHVSIVYQLRQALQLDEPHTPVKIIDPFQMLGEIKPDLMDALEIDVIGILDRNTLFGFPNENWKPWTTFDGTPVLVPEKFNTQVTEKGHLFLYPEGDTTAPPSGHMPKDGYYFDAIVRQPPIIEEDLNVEDNIEEFTPISKESLDFFKSAIDRAYETTDKAIFATFGGTSFGDIALVPAPQLKHPKGIRDIEEWYISTVVRQDYIGEVFERQCQIALDNFKRIFEAVGNRVSIVFITGTDFGAQNALFLSKEMYHRLYMPFHKRINDWVHENTEWKTFIHSCGAIMPLIESFIEAGFDILNPIQCSAKGMDEEELKERFGQRISFWGGGIDTQKTLPFGTPQEVSAEVAKRIEVFGQKGGFIFNTTHNVQAKSPIENILAMYETLKAKGRYPL